MAKSYIYVMLAAAVFVLTTGAAAAGGNPELKICDQAGLIGSAYGACNVYCEALDCDGPPDPRRERACATAFDRFIELTGDVPPCEPVCPCAPGWLDPGFIPEDVDIVECYVEVGDAGAMWDLRIEGGLDENGQFPLSAGGFDVFEDANEGYRRFGCFSERFLDGQWDPSEDSGVFEMTATIRAESPNLRNFRDQMVTSCETVLRGLVGELGVECVVADNRTD